MEQETRRRGLSDCKVAGSSRYTIYELKQQSASLPVCCQDFGFHSTSTHSHKHTHITYIALKLSSKPFFSGRCPKNVRYTQNGNFPFHCGTKQHLTLAYTLLNQSHFLTSLLLYPQPFYQSLFSETEALTHFHTYTRTHLRQYGISFDNPNHQGSGCTYPSSPVRIITVYNLYANKSTTLYALYQAKSLSFLRFLFSVPFLESF